MNHKIAFTFPPFKPEGYDELKEKGCEVFMPEPGFAYSADDLSSLPEDAEVTASSFTHPITEEVMNHFPHLRMIATYGVGFNNIDLDAAKKRGIAVSNTPPLRDSRDSRADDGAPAVAHPTDHRLGQQTSSRSRCREYRSHGDRSGR